jgi:hypothetical protein
MIDRRQFAAGSAALAVAGCTAPARHNPLPGTLGGASSARGHLLRQALAVGPPDDVIETGIVIIGGGIAGLSAGWTLADAGRDDFLLLELEDTTGGNARSGRTAISAHPLGAHYLPVPNPESRGVIRLLEQMRLITGWQGDKPVFDEFAVVADPDQRLLYRGRWQEGLIPALGATAQDKADIAAFFAAMDDWRTRTGRDGRPAFSIPLELASRDPAILALDRLRFTDWVAAQGWQSPLLAAHLRYACRDEYGCEPHDTSAWAGIHYFAGRRGQAANCAGDAVLTWPAGNGHLAGRMAGRLRGQIRPAMVVGRVEPHGAGVRVTAIDARRRRRVEVRAQAAIIAVPRFIASRIVAGWEGSDAGFSYAPWVVANASVSRPPAGPGAALAWDNVSATSNSLGYVVATHQSLRSAPGPTVLSWYMPLSESDPATARQLMLRRTLGEWQAMVRDDLIAMNPDLAGAITRIDVWRWGHAMARPTPGFIWGDARQAAARLQGPILPAHSDISGIPVFEEAHDRGAAAALVALGRDPGEARA